MGYTCRAQPSRSRVPTDRVLSAVYAILNGPEESTATPEGLYRHVRAYLSESHEFWSDTSQDGVEPDDALVDWGDTFRCCLDGQIVAKPVEEPSH